MATAIETPDTDIRPDFTLGPEKLRKAAEDALAKARRKLDELAALPDGKRTFENTVQAFDRILDDMSTETVVSTFPKYVSADKAAREAAHACEGELEKFSVDVFSRPDLYAAMKSAAKTRETLDAADRKLLDRTLKDFKRSGLDLEPLERARFNILKKQLLDMELAFGKNLNEVRDFLPVTREELDGLPEDFIGRLGRTEDGRFKVTLDYPDVYPFLDEAKNADARRRLHRLFGNRAVPENIALLDEIFSLRRRLAAMLGYASHGHFILDERMARTPEEVARFLADLRGRLEEKSRPERERLLALKRKDEPRAERVEPWDGAYYHNQLKKSAYGVDETKVREYFPLPHVLDSMFEIYRRLLGVEYRKAVPGSGWHPDVMYYETYDAKSGEPLGRFYLDLHPRDGKFKHAAAFPLIGGRREPGGAYRLPLNAMVANFSMPTGGRPALLKHSEVNTLFHEFGHVMHAALTRAKHARFSGTRVLWDFVEAPSQMLENWLWNKEVLRKLSRHFETGDPLPDDLIDRMIAAKNLDSGIAYLRQLSYSVIDQAYHQAESGDTGETFRRLYEEVNKTPPAPGTRPEASFGHLVGYAAAYYSYLWAEVFAADMFSVFEKEGILNPETGLRYRKTVLERGGEGEESEYLREFLGREPNQDAFLKSIGL